MSQRENIFVATSATVREVASWMTNHMGFGTMNSAEDTSTDIGLRRSALISDGMIGIRIQVNTFAVPDAASDEIQATDAYPIQIDLWAPGRTIEIQKAEGREVFDRLVSSSPQTSALLTHDLDILVCAYLAGVGTHEFLDKTTIDIPDLERWKPWVVDSKQPGQGLPSMS